MRLVPAAGTRLALVLAIAGAMTLLFAGSAQAFIYWASSQDNSIGRASNDGTGVDPHFIATGSLPFMTAVDSAHIYWVNMNGGSIGRANIDGSGVDNGFISGVTTPSGVAVISVSIF